MTEQELRERLKAAMRARDTRAATVLRGVLAAVKNKAIESRKPGLEESEVASVLQREVKQCRETLEFAAKSGREETMRENQANLEVLEDLLPEPLGEAELREAVAAILEETEAAAIGPVMKELASRFAGRYDGKTASAMVREMLAQR